MLAEYSARPFAIRAIAGIGVAFAVIAVVPPSVALADDQQSAPGAPIVRSADKGVVSGGPSTVYAGQRGVVVGGVVPNSNGGGLVKDGNSVAPGSVGMGTLCGTTAMGGYDDGVGGGALRVFDCGSDFIPDN